MIPEKIKQEILKAEDKAVRSYLALHLLSKKGAYDYVDSIYVIRNYKHNSSGAVFPVETDYPSYNTAYSVPAMQAFADDDLDKEVKVHYSFKDDTYYLSFREYGGVNFSTDDEREVVRAIHQYQAGRLRFSKSSKSLIKKSIYEVAHA